MCEFRFPNVVPEELNSYPCFCLEEQNHSKIVHSKELRSLIEQVYSQPDNKINTGYNLSELINSEKYFIV